MQRVQIEADEREERGGTLRQSAATAHEQQVAAGGRDILDADAMITIGERLRKTGLHII